MIIEGKAWILGDNIDTDVIIPARYLNLVDPTELGKHCLEDLDPSLAKKFHKNDFLIAGENFGCGSSREHAPISLKASGLGGVIAKSFARIFFRNAINTGFPLFECPDLPLETKEGDIIRIDTDKGTAENLTRSRTYTIAPFPPFIKKIIKAGGLMKYLKQQRPK
ncbi:MAG: 3-isopropylmalate dehydratase small subunit [Candidatus Ranarchaeia archaeon]|jgi:3-isopropylmalate/(R)-2-methylmalate dehydratase small subunit